ncbi:unnamed protein product [Caretta caretta]
MASPDLLVLQRFGCKQLMGRQGRDHRLCGVMQITARAPCCVCFYLPGSATTADGHTTTEEFRGIHISFSFPAGELQANHSRVKSPVVQQGYGNAADLNIC